MKDNKMEYKIKQTKIIDSDFIDSIRANSERYYDTYNKKLTNKTIVNALQKMDNPKYKVTKALNRILNGREDSSDTNFVIEIALYGEIQ